MKSLQILDVKDFMAKLLTTDAFDAFLVPEASVTTFTTFRMEGTYFEEYFDKTSDHEENPAQKETHPSWRLLRPLFFNLIKGKNPPLNLKLVLRLADYNVEKLLSQSGIPLHVQDIAGLYLNIYYDGKNVSCTIGSSVRVFSLDKTLDHTWEEMTCKFLKQKEIPYS